MPRRGKHKRKTCEKLLKTISKNKIRFEQGKTYNFALNLLQKFLFLYKTLPLFPRVKIMRDFLYRRDLSNFKNSNLYIYVKTLVLKYFQKIYKKGVNLD
jgi:hypothetical protein